MGSELVVLIYGGIFIKEALEYKEKMFMKFPTKVLRYYGLEDLKDFQIVYVYRVLMDGKGFVTPKMVSSLTELKYFIVIKNGYLDLQGFKWNWTVCVFIDNILVSYTNSKNMVIIICK